MLRRDACWTVVAVCLLLWAMGGPAHAQPSPPPTLTQQCTQGTAVDDTNGWTFTCYTTTAQDVPTTCGVQGPWLVSATVPRTT